jgi:hypothetical protein
MTAKTPTPQGISALLRKAGFQRAAVSTRDGYSGFQVTKCHTRVGAVKVRQYFFLGGSPAARYREPLRRYANVIEAAGYSAEMYTHHLIVIALAAKAEETGFGDWSLDRLIAQRDHLQSILLVSVGQSDRPQIREEYDAVCAEIAKREADVTLERTVNAALRALEAGQ